MNKGKKESLQKESEVAQQLTPSEYFAKLKDAKQNITSENLKESYNVILELAKKYGKTGQNKSLEKLKFLAQTICEEEKLITLGITTFIYRDTIEDYIDNVANDVVKIIELSNYMREVPDEIADTVEKTKDIFSEFYVVFTDYTGREERRVEQERRDKDPILFGCFKQSQFVADRFYFLGDWVDEYCDLTLDKLVEVYRDKKDGNTPLHEIETPQTAEELVELLKAYQPKGGNNAKLYVANHVTTNVLNYTSEDGSNDKKLKRTSFFAKVKSVFSK